MNIENNTPTLREEILALLGELEEIHFKMEVPDVARFRKAKEMFYGLRSKLTDFLDASVKGFGQNQKLTEALSDAREQIQTLREEVEELSAPPNRYGIFSGKNADGTANIYVGGIKYKVRVHPLLASETFLKGQELELNGNLAIIGIAEFGDQGGVVIVKELLGGGRVLVTVRQDDHRVALLADSLEEVALKQGDLLMFDERSGYVLEKLPKSEVQDLLLEAVPDITYEKIGGLGAQIESIRDAIELPYLYSEYFREHKLAPPKGVLLYGPPGCGKTLIAKAVAHSLAEQIKAKTGQDVTGYFLNIKGPELLNKYVGETERQIREIFVRAKEKASDGSPVVVFFDEMDSLFRTRGSGISSDVESTIVPQFLAELDGVEGLKNVIIIGASNRQDLIDPAVLRPGRFDVKIKIDRPDQNGTKQILSIYCTDDLPLMLEEYAKTEREFSDPDKKGVMRTMFMYDEKGNYIPRDRYGNPRHYFACDLASEERNDKDLKEMRFLIQRDSSGRPNPADIVRYFIDRMAIELWGLTPQSAAWSQFVEITYRDGREAKIKVMSFRHFMSGATLESIVTRAKKSAVKRLIATKGTKKEERGLRYSDFYNAIRDEFNENEDLPNTTNHDEWAKIMGKGIGEILNVRTIRNKSPEEKRKVETITTGQYL